MQNVYIYIMGIGASIVFISGAWLQMKAFREFGVMRSLLIPFEELFVCLTNWPSAKFAAKSLLFGLVLVIFGYAMILRA